MNPMNEMSERRILKTWLSKLLITTSVGFTVFSGVARAEQYSGGAEKLKSFMSREMVVTNLKDLEKLGLMSGQTCERELVNPNGYTVDAKYQCKVGANGKVVKSQPWASTSWPDRLGSIAEPYANRGSASTIARLWGWSNARGKIINESRDAKLKNIAAQDQEFIDNLSPAEKYDLIVGDPDFTFSRAVVNMVDFLEEKHQTALWSGICHGWGPASTTMPRPKHAFKVKSALGPTVTVYPDDMKGIMAFMWGKTFAQDYAKLEGWGCPNKDNTTPLGRLLHPSCFDVNPAFLHLMAANHIGLSGSGFIMDIQFKQHVYNQPTFKFESEYYNPETLSSSESLKDSVVRVGSYPDAYEDFRAPGTQYIVGVNTELSYLKEVDPSHSQTDGPDRDDVGKLKIRYELELDANYEIIGGEWRQFRDPWEPRMSEVADYAQPDILWIMPDGVRAWAAVDENIASDWNGIGVPPANWATASKLGSAVTKEQFYKYTGKKEIVPNPQPLSKIVYSLLELSQ